MPFLFLCVFPRDAFLATQRVIAWAGAWQVSIEPFERSQNVRSRFLVCGTKQIDSENVEPLQARNSKERAFQSFRTGREFVSMTARNERSTLRLTVYRKVKEKSVSLLP